MAVALAIGMCVLKYTVDLKQKVTFPYTLFCDKLE